MGPKRPPPVEGKIDSASSKPITVTSTPSDSNDVGVLFDAPTSGAVAGVVGLGRRKGAVALVARGDDADLTEPDDVNKSIAVDISEETKMSVQFPTTSIVAKVVQSAIDIAGTEGPPTIVLGRMSQRPVRLMSAKWRMCFSTRQPPLTQEDHLGSIPEGVVVVIGGKPAWPKQTTSVYLSLTRRKCLLAPQPAALHPKSLITFTAGMLIALRGTG